MRLFHFSDSGTIRRFIPGSVEVPSARRPGEEWLNGPLVWAIDERHQAMYLFPRDCPRILTWPTTNTSNEDRAAWMSSGSKRMIAYIERARVRQLRSATLYCYELPPGSFEPLNDAGMWVSHQEVTPNAVEVLEDLPAALAELGIELRILRRLTALRGLWTSSLHVSGIRLRNADGWN